MRELSHLFSEFSTNHISFINLLASSLKSDIEEGEFYAAGRKSIIKVNQVMTSLAQLESEFPLNSNQKMIAASLANKLDIYYNQMGNTVLMGSVELELIRQFTLDANTSYDAANKEFLSFIDAVQEAMRSSVTTAHSDLTKTEYQYVMLLSATLFFITLLSLLLSGLFTTDLKSVLGLLTRLSEGDTKIDTNMRERGDEFGAINNVVERFKQALISRTQMEVNLRKEIAERVQAENFLRQSEEKFRILFEDNPLLLISIDQQGLITSVNRSCETQLGYTVNQLSGMNIYKLIYQGDEAFVEQLIRQCMAEPQARHQYTLRKRHLNGNALWFRDTAKLIVEEGEKFILLACEDVTETKMLTERLSWQATHDNLTGLINRWEFENRLVNILENAKQTNSEHVLCFLDLDQFKIINDTCGHSAGDELLKQISSLLKNQIRTRDTLGRLGGDEFGVLLEYCALKSGHRTAKNILSAVEKFRFIWGEQQFRIGVSIGLIPIDKSCEGLSEIMAGADAACYAAKEHGRNRIHIYAASDQQLVQRHGEMQWALRIPEALEKNHFELFCQDILPLNRNEILGKSIEILVRMRNEQTGEIILPNQFLPAAERYNFVEHLDRWVIASAFQALRALEKTRYNIESFAINLSGHSLGNLDFLDFVLNEIKSSGIRAETICFEITETAVISNISSARLFITRLKQEGVCFALDDFGTGLSSFAYLHELPVDFLKIDGMFVREIASSRIQYAMVKSINEIGHLMGMKTIAECVETQAILSKLEEIGVDYCQGFYIGRPRPLSQLNYLRNTNHSSS